MKNFESEPEIAEEIAEASDNSVLALDKTRIELIEQDLQDLDNARFVYSQGVTDESQDILGSNNYRLNDTPVV